MLSRRLVPSSWRLVLRLVIGVGLVVGPALIAQADPAAGDLLATVHVPVAHCTPAPACGSLGVGGTFDGTNYIYINFDFVNVVGTLHIMTPPPGDGTGTLVASKAIVDAVNNPVAVSAIAWDPSRGKLWGAYAGNLYLIDISGAGDAVATLQFTTSVGGSDLIDGLAYDGGDDTVYYSPDVNLHVYHFSPIGTLLNTVTPKDAGGVEDGSVSGVAVGSNLLDGTGTLYIGRDGASEIRRIKKVTGDFVSNFATTSGRVEDLTCDPVTYAPKEAILAKDSYNNLYEAFEVELGTCPLPRPQVICTLGFWKNHPEEWTTLDPNAVPAWGGGLTYLQIFGLPPSNGDASIILAHAYIAALLNTGAPAADLAAALALLTAHPVGSGDLKAGKNAIPDRAAALQVAASLQAFNESATCQPPR